MSPELATLRKTLGDHRVRHVGSRVTCNPAPTDTDDDWLVLHAVPEGTYKFLMAAGWELGGSEANMGVGESFQSCKKGEENIILTHSPSFFDKFIAATRVAKRFNLVNKEDRVALFEAVLYGTANRCWGNLEEDLAPNAFNLEMLLAR